jgi:hypothetical protein
LKPSKQRPDPVLIKNYSEIGSLYGLGGTAKVTSWEFTDAQTGKKQQGISVEVKEHDRLEREERAFIDYDEIDSLLAGIDYISRVSPDSLKLKRYEAVYRTKGSLAITFFNDTEGLQVAVSAGQFGPASAYFKPDKFEGFRKMIVDAKAALDAIR